MSSAIKIGVHDCDDNYELKSYAKLFSCDGCKTSGFGERYHCNLCGNELHQKCRFPKATVTHELFEGSTFTFRDQPFTRYDSKLRRTVFSKICDVCGKKISGFSYRCEENDLDVHPTCLNLGKKVLIDEDTVLDLKARVESECLWCNKRKISDNCCGCARGWSYVSTCKKYNFHVHCMTEMAQEACVRNVGEMGLEKVEVRTLVKKKKSSRNRSVVEMIKAILKIVLSALLGDPTLLISSLFVELVSKGIQ